MTDKIVNIKPYLCNTFEQYIAADNECYCLLKCLAEINTKFDL